MPHVTSVRYATHSDRDTLESWRKIDHAVSEFLYTWELWKRWDTCPPIVVLAGNRIAGFHGVSYTKSGYVNSAVQFVLEEFRGRRLAGKMIDFLLREAMARGMCRLRFRTPIEGPGEQCWRGFGVPPFGRCESEYWYDVPISQAPTLSRLMSMSRDRLLSPATTDARTLGHYRRSGVIGHTDEWSWALETNKAGKTPGPHQALPSKQLDALNKRLDKLTLDQFAARESAGDSRLAKFFSGLK